MKIRSLPSRASIAVLGLIIAAGAAAVAQQGGDAKPAADQPQIKLPPGWTAADMQAYMLGSTPGKMHEHLAQGLGEWEGKCTMWMYPGADPLTSQSKSTVTKVMDGRYIKCEMAGEMPGMGPYAGFGLVGFDNVSQKFVSTWIDNHSTGMMNGTGELSPDGKTLTWNFSFNCPITKQPALLREIETITGPNTKTLEMFGADPKSGKEFQMMKIEMTRK